MASCDWPVPFMYGAQVGQEMIGKTAYSEEYNDQFLPNGHKRKDSSGWWSE